MHKIVNNLIQIQNNIQQRIKELNLANYKPKIVAISKTFSSEYISPLIEYGHLDFGENKVQEAMEKWPNLKEKYKNLSLHMVGKLQSNKVKHAVKIFDYIHSVDNIKLAKKISDEQKKYNKKPKIFIQINIANEYQKAGLSKNELKKFYLVCKKLDLQVIGTMCLPPENETPDLHFQEMYKLNKNLNLNEISMGMSNDYLDALKYKSTFLRIGSKIFGERF